MNLYVLIDWIIVLGAVFGFLYAFFLLRTKRKPKGDRFDIVMIDDYKDFGVILRDGKEDGLVFFTYLDVPEDRRVS